MTAISFNINWNIYKSSYILLFFFILFFLLFVFTSCDSKKNLQSLDAKKFSIEQAKNVDINYTLGGKIKAKLTSALMLLVQDSLPYVEFPHALHVDFYSDSGKIESKLDAMYAKYFQSQNKVFLKDSVTIINIKGDTLHCNELYWDRSNLGNEFYTNKPVRIRTKTNIIDGIGMESAQDFKNWHIIDPTGIIRLPSSQFPGN